MDEKEMAKYIMEVIHKANDLKKTMSALYIVQEEIKRQITSNIEKAQKELEWHSMQQIEFKSFLAEIANIKVEQSQSKKPWDGTLKEDR